jgi:hypothetical protein
MNVHNRLKIRFTYQGAGWLKYFAAQQFDPAHAAFTGTAAVLHTNPALSNDISNDSEARTGISGHY